MMVEGEMSEVSEAEMLEALDVAHDAGLSGPGRLHDLFVTHEALTPGEWKTQAAGVDLRYGWHDSPFGDCLIIASPRGVCGMAFEGRQGQRGRTILASPLNAAACAVTGRVTDVREMF